MKIVKPSVKILFEVNGEEILRRIERAGRVCYKSEENITEDSHHKFVERILKSGHESVIEHVSVSALVVCDRGVSHEIVRHRIASYSQESTRYCNYSNDKFNKEITFIEPCFWEHDTSEYKCWRHACGEAEDMYFELLRLGCSPQEARSVLPNSLKTEIVMTMNLREWRHFFRLRTSEKAHPQMREVASILLKEFHKTIPVVFDDLV